jgi:GDP-4-dehydro-6-deoxy-D-mannose reductase
VTRTLVITGANGFVGGHLAAVAAQAGVEVWAVGRESEPDARLAAHCDRYYSADLLQEWPVPPGADAVVHLAGLAAVGASFAQPQRYLDVNSGITTTMCEALLGQGDRPRVVVVSSGSVYSSPRDATPLSESSELAASSPYAVAKILVETQAAYYARRGLDTVIARPFNHIGPGQGPGFIVPDLAADLRALPAGQPMRVGNLAAARDFTDVRDVARAYLLLALSPKHAHHIYNVASGESHTGFEVLAEIARSLGRTIPETIVDQSRLRPDDPPTIAGDSTRLRDEFSWAPTVDWRTSVRERVQSTD